MLGRILRASVLRIVLGAAMFLRILKSFCVKMILTGCLVEDAEDAEQDTAFCSVQEDSVGQPYWKGSEEMQS